MYFGESSDLPDWRNEPHNDEEEATPEERAAVVKMLGFDPASYVENSEGKWVKKGGPGDDTESDE